MSQRVSEARPSDPHATKPWDPRSVITSVHGVDGTGLLDHALRYAGLGWPVLPIVPRGKVPLTARGLKDATTETDAIMSWWTRWPNANIAVRTDEYVVIDCDGFVGKRTFGLLIGPVGFASSPYAWTGGGGMHVWYRRDGLPIRNRAGWLDCVDIRSEGGYCIVPPSIHPNGRRYYWEYSPDERPVPHLPDVLRDALIARSSRGVSPRVRAANRVTHEYATVALDGEIAKVRNAPEGQRNQMLVTAAFNLGQLVAVGSLDPGEVAGALLSAATAAGLPAAEAMRTIRSGLRGGFERPRTR